MSSFFFFFVVPLSRALSFHVLHSFRKVKTICATYTEKGREGQKAEGSRGQVASEAATRRKQGAKNVSLSRSSFKSMKEKCNDREWA